MSSDTSDRSSALFQEDADEDNAIEPSEDTQQETKRIAVPDGRRGHDAFGSLIDDW
jgi:hypothetical protein